MWILQYNRHGVILCIFIGEKFVKGLKKLFYYVIMMYTSDVVFARMYDVTPRRKERLGLRYEMSHLWVQRR